MKHTHELLKESAVLFATWLAAVAFVDLVKMYSTSYLSTFGAFWADLIMIGIGLAAVYIFKYKLKW